MRVHDHELLDRGNSGNAAMDSKYRQRFSRTRAAEAGWVLIVLLFSVLYIGSVFELRHPIFWKAGLGDWTDPYFINFLLEHWYHSLRTVSDPLSPPMFFPVRGTLGYSHGLILYAPFYVVLRSFFHPFQAYGLTLFLVIEIGVLCLYLVFRRFVQLSFIDSLLLTTLFLSSRNVIGGFMGTWAQTASVFLIPAILLLTLESAHVKPGAGHIVLAWCSGLLATLLFAQDFYTAQFALIVAIVGVAPSVAIAARSGPVERLTSARNEPLSRGAKAGILIMVLGAGWMSWVWIYGGATVRILGLRVASHDWLRPALVMAAGLALFLYTGGGARARTTLTRATPWSVAFTVGAVVGTIIFLLIYVPAYREHPAFPAHHLLNSLILRDPSHWHTPDDIVRDLAGYSSERPFYLIFILAVLGCVPTFKADRRTRLACLWFLCFSVLVLLIPFRFGEFSVWKTVFQPLPGCFAIRDPKRIIYVYELAVVLAAGLFIARLPPAAKRRAATAAILIVLLAAEPNWIHFEFRRPNETYARWVERPIDIDPSCRSFFIEAASPGYTARPNGGVTMYQIDSMFVALNHSIPTLNGYSAFLPPGWPLNDPRDPGYAEVAASWAGHHNLQGVCAFDIERRTMTPAW